MWILFRTWKLKKKEKLPRLLYPILGIMKIIRNGSHD